MACTHTADTQGERGLEKRWFFSQDQSLCCGGCSSTSCKASSASSASLVGLLLLLRHSFTLSVVLSLRSPHSLLISFPLLSDVLLCCSNNPVCPAGGRRPRHTFVSRSSCDVLRVVACEDGWHTSLVNNVHRGYLCTLSKSLACLHIFVPTKSCFGL